MPRGRDRASALVSRIFPLCRESRLQWSWRSRSPRAGESDRWSRHQKHRRRRPLSTVVVSKSRSDLALSALGVELGNAPACEVSIHGSVLPVSHALKAKRPRSDPSAATGTSRTRRSTSKTGVRTRSIQASCRKSANGSEEYSKPLVSSTSSAHSTARRSNTHGGQTAGARGRKMSDGGSIIRSQLRELQSTQSRVRSTRRKDSRTTRRSRSTTAGSCSACALACSR